MFARQTGFVGYEGAIVNSIGATAFPNTPIGSSSLIEYSAITTNFSKFYRDEPSDLVNISETYLYSSSRSPRYSDFNNTHFLSYQPVGARMNTSRAFYRGNLLCHIVGNRTGTSYVSTTYDYNINEREDSPILTTDAFTICDYSNAIGINPYGTPDYGIGTYLIIPYNKTKSYEMIEDTDGSIKRIKYDYFFDDYTDRLDYKLVKSKSVMTSEGDVKTTYFTYPCCNGYYLPMVECEVTICDEEIVQAKRMVYDNTTRQLKEVYELSSDADANSLIPTSQITTLAQMQSIYTLTYEYRYNAKGNLIEIKYKGIPLASYIWGYNGLYPIIEANNIGYEQLVDNAIIAGLTHEQINGMRISTQLQIDAVADKMRLQLPKTEITSLAYHWLFGIVKKTNVRGLSMQYEYDKHGRLTSVYDFNKYLINKYEYNYSLY